MSFIACMEYVYATLNGFGGRSRGTRHASAWRIARRGHDGADPLLGEGAVRALEASSAQHEQGIMPATDAQLICACVEYAMKYLSSI